MDESNAPPRLSVGIDFGATYTAVALKGLVEDRHGSQKDVNKAISFGQNIQDHWKLPMTFGLVQTPAGEWDIALEDELQASIRPAEQIRYLKFAGQNPESVLDSATTLAARDSMSTGGQFAFPDGMVTLLSSSTYLSVQAELSKVQASGFPQEIITKALRRIWNRHIWPAVQKWAAAAKVAAEEVVLDVTIGFPAVWSQEQSRAYGRLLMKGVQHGYIGSLSMVEEAHATLIGAMLGARKVDLETGKIYTIFDAGGGTIDAASCLVVSRDPLVLRPVFSATQGHSAWYGFETIMMRFSRILAACLPDLVQDFVDQAMLGDMVVEMLTDVRSQIHRLEESDISDQQRQIRLRHNFLVRTLPNNSTELEAAGILLHNISEGEIVLSGNLARTVVDCTMKPAIDLLKDHVKKIFKFCRSHRDLKHSGVLVTSGGFFKNRYFWHSVQRSAYSASGGSLKEDKIFDYSLRKSVLAVGAAHFSEGDRANAGRFVDRRLGIISALTMTASEQIDTPFTTTEKHPSGPELVLMHNLFMWGVEGGLIRGCEKLSDGGITLRLAWAPIDTEQRMLAEDPWSPLTNVFISAADEPLNSITRESEERISFSEKELADMHVHGIENDNSVVAFGVRLRWIGGSVVCSVLIPLTSGPIDNESFMPNKCVGKTVSVDIESKPDVFDLSKLLSTISDRPAPPKQGVDVQMT